MAIQATGVLLEGCVLSLISKEDTYGYILTQYVKDSLGVSESTLYPIMRRLQTEGCLQVYDIPHNGRNRRYYKITTLGQEKYKDAIEKWQDFVKRVDSVIYQGGERNE